MSLEPTEEVNPLGSSRITSIGIGARPEPFHVGSALLPNGQRISLLKTLQTSACERNCYYCPFRAGRDFRRATLKPDEMAQALNALHRAGIVQGAFLSSGIAGGSVRTQDQLLATAELLRRKFNFTGYLHLKLMPGIEKAQVEQAMQWADRVSLNLEAPNSRRLALLAPRKDFLDDLLLPLRWVEEIRRTRPGYQGWKGHWPSLVTQFVVGAAGESDLELLSTTVALQRQLRLSRTYFSAFSPIEDTPLENAPATDPLRQHRLYQASFLLRDYDFDLEDLLFDGNGNLPLKVDPKLAWAQTYLLEAPVEVNRADRNVLLRVPGVGPKNAEAILKARQIGRLRFVEDLHRLGVRTERAAPYILLDGRRLNYQLSLF